jgi:hypothetical protein
VKDLTVNFNQRGTATPAINALYMFAGAGIQGSARILSALRHPKVQKLVAYTVLASVVADLLNRAFDEDDEYDKLPEYIKERNLVFVNPIGKGLITIPAPWGYNAIWGIGREIGRAISHATGDLPNWSPWDSASNIGSSLFDAFMPVGGGTLLQTLSPTVLDPFVAIEENKNAFGQTLRPEPYPGQLVPPSEQYFRNVSNFSRKAAAIVNEWTGGDKVTAGWGSFSPENLDVIAAQIFGSLGRQIKDFAAIPTSIASGKLELSRAPVVRKFYTEAGTTQEPAIYHDNVAQILGAKRLVKEYSEGPNSDDKKLARVQQDRAAVLRMVPQVEDVERQIRSIRKAIRNNRNDPQTESILRDRIVQLQKRFNTSYSRRVENH